MCNNKWVEENWVLNNGQQYEIAQRFLCFVVQWKVSNCISLLLNATILYLAKLCGGVGNKDCVFNVHESVHRNNIQIYIQQDATLHSLFYLETALHVLGDNITNHQKRKQLYLQHLVSVTSLLLSAAIVEELELV
jgi:hypothetical protein